MTPQRILDSPLSWAVAGFGIGLGLAVNSGSVWLLAAGLGLFVLYLRAHGDADETTETLLFAAGPTFIVAWLVGFIVHSLVF